jgi:catechol 2,3-dioxygenase-like lactoylglutathione lyase family enzyme
MIRTKGLTHIHLIVRDMKRSLRFYKAVFGMQMCFKESTKLVFLNTPGSKDLIALHEDPDMADVAGTSGGISHFGFELVKTNLDNAIKEVEKAGGKLLERDEHAPGVPYAYVADPDGYVIEL